MALQLESTGNWGETPAHNSDSVSHRALRVTFYERAQL